MAEFLRQYKPAHFDTRELVSKAMYEKRGEKAISLLCPHILYSMDTLRVYLTDLTPSQPWKGALTVNDWMYGGRIHARGRRAPGDNDYSATSQHASGTALDAVSKYYTAQELRNIIIENRELFPYVTCLEGDVSWLHMDSRNLPAGAPEGAIMIVYPNGTYEYV